jgi:hypothetical protein
MKGYRPAAIVEGDEAEKAKNQLYKKEDVIMNQIHKQDGRSENHGRRERDNLSFRISQGGKIRVISLRRST